MAARVGLIIPSSNRMVEQEMVQAFPPEVQTHVTRLRMTGAHQATLSQLLPRIEDATAALCDARCDVVAFHCTANAMQEGLDGEQRVREAMEHAGARRMTTTATAIRAALDALRAHRIVLITPYDDATTAHEAEYLRAASYDVLSATGFDLGGSDAFCATPPQFWRDRTIETAHPDADAYLISCANISTFPIIAATEAEIGRPVVTSNQAVVWDTLRRVDGGGHADGLGRLFATT